MRGQAAVEYLVLLSSVIILALVAIAILGYMPGIGSEAKVTESDTYWRAGRPFAILEAKEDPAGGTIALVVQNIEAQDIILKMGFVKSGTATVQTPFDEKSPLGKFAPGQKKTIELNIPVKADPGATRYEYYISFDFKTSGDGMVQKETGSKPLIGPSPPVSCGLQGSACAIFSDCCSNVCQAGTCCTEYGSCTIDSQCCQGHCWDGFCCQQAGFGCTGEGECCSGTACNIVEGTGTCLTCSGFGKTCTNAVTDCCPAMGCTSEEYIDEHGDVITIPGICCKDDGAHCTSDGQCCGGLYCDLSSYSCRDCKMTGYCLGDNECCGTEGYYCNRWANGGLGNCEHCKQNNEECLLAEGDKCCSLGGEYGYGSPLTCNNNVCCQGEGYSNPSSCCDGFVIDPYEGHPYCCIPQGGSGCNSDADCCWNNYCYGGTCVEVLDYGNTCDRNRQCFQNASEGLGNNTWCIGGECCLNPNTYTPPCTDSSQCCNFAQCVEGACCKLAGTPADYVTECCGGAGIIIDEDVELQDSVCCKRNGASCSDGPQCCNHICESGYCCREIGGSCTQDSECCESGNRAYCDLGGTGQCQTSVGFNQPCERTRQCANGLVCLDGRCQACAGGNPCESNADCCKIDSRQGYVCDMAEDAHYCRWPSNLGEACTRSEECLNGAYLAPPYSAPHMYCKLDDEVCVHRYENPGDVCDYLDSCNNQAGVPGVYICSENTVPPRCQQCTINGPCVTNNECCSGYSCNGVTCQ